MSSIYKKFCDEWDNLDLIGRDALYSHLLQQEAPMWYRQVGEGKLVSKAEIDWLVSRRGFNEEETKKLRALANFMNRYADYIPKFLEDKQQEEQAQFPIAVRTVVQRINKALVDGADIMKSSEYEDFEIIFDREKNRVYAVHHVEIPEADKLKKDED